MTLSRNRLIVLVVIVVLAIGAAIGYFTYQRTLGNRWKQGGEQSDGVAGSPLYGPQTEIVPVTLGKLQRRLSRIWLIRPDAVVSTTELARAAFPRAFGVITHNHRRSIRRAALRIAVTVGRSDCRGRPLLWRAK